MGAAICVAAAAAGCGSGAAAPSILGAAPRTYLLSVDQLVAPDFTLDTAPHAFAAADLAAGDQARLSLLTSAGFSAGSGEDFFRPTANLAVLNGPVQIGDTVEQFSASAGAVSVYAADVTVLDAVPGATAVSTGALGDAAHCTTRLVMDSSGVQLAELTVEWRVANLLDILVVRGRYGGVRADDALALAHRQTVQELGLSTPTPLPTASPSPRPSSTPSATAGA
jgi:hypothetical protein